MKARRVLELNPQSPAFAALQRAKADDEARAKDYVELLYAQACLNAGLELENVAEYTRLVCSLMI